MAHEVGHFMLHPKANYHRDRILTGGERANFGRSEIEQEADAFAAELLMPRKVLNRKFTEALGSQFDGRRPNFNAAFWLSAGTDRAVTEIRLADDLRYRAMVIAETRSRSVRIAGVISSGACVPGDAWREMDIGNPRVAGGYGVASAAKANFFRGIGEFLVLKVAISECGA